MKGFSFYFSLIPLIFGELNQGANHGKFQDTQH